MAKQSKVLTRYRLAMALEDVLRTEYPAYVEIPREIEEKAYLWSEYARGNEVERQEAKINRFVGRQDVLRQIWIQPARSHLAGRRL